MKKSLRIATYVRATPESLAGQRAALAKHCRDRSLKIVGEYADTVSILKAATKRRGEAIRRRIKVGLKRGKKKGEE